MSLLEPLQLLVRNEHVAKSDLVEKDGSIRSLIASLFDALE